MQKTKSYLWLVAATGVVSAFVASACVVTTSTDGNSAGSSNSDAGTSAGGASTAAGAAGTAVGGSNTAGTAGTAGAATAGTGGTSTATTPACDSNDPNAPPIGTPSGTCTAAGTDACGKCLQAKCCTEYSECNGTGPGNVCGFGGPKNVGEFTFYRTCLKALFAKNGAISDSDRQSCSNNSVTSTDSMGALDCGSLGNSTNALIGCVMEKSCNEACYGS